MAFCKICSCGTKTVFEKRMSYPISCPSCGRKLEEFSTYNENDPAVDILMSRIKANKSEHDASVSLNNSSENPLDELSRKNYVLILSNNKEIVIPEEGCIIGRTETGAEALAEFSSVSRQHLRMTPKRRRGILAEDLSTYGTLINGIKMEKNMPKIVEVGAIITLTNVDATLELK